MKRTWLMLIVPWMVFGCSTAMPPQELVSARAAYDRAAAGDAARLKPAQLHEAKDALDRAEATFKDEGASDTTVSAAYVALRKAEYAEALGGEAAAREQRLSLEREAAATKDQMLEKSGKKLEATEGALAKEKDALARERDAVAKAREATAAERTARLEAENKAKEAMDALAKSMTTKTDERGTVITLPGSVLFVTGKATLLPGARDQLDKVATALEQQAERRFTVEGHTDNVGTDAVNSELSRKRAEAVRDYLILRGVSANAISAVGFGPTRPVGDNKTLEGRAMNRRVEIVVSDK